jgi:hypothetical protein
MRRRKRKVVKPVTKKHNRGGKNCHWGCPRTAFPASIGFMTVYDDL